MFSAILRFWGTDGFLCMLGIPTKLNADSEGKPNGIPGQDVSAVPARRRLLRYYFTNNVKEDYSLEKPG